MAQTIIWTPSRAQNVAFAKILYLNYGVGGHWRLKSAKWQVSERIFRSLIDATGRAGLDHVGKRLLSFSEIPDPEPEQ